MKKLFNKKQTSNKQRTQIYIARKVILLSWDEEKNAFVNGYEAKKGTEMHKFTHDFIWTNILLGGIMVLPSQRFESIQQSDEF